MEAAKSLSGTQGCGPGAAKLGSQLGPRRWHRLIQSGDVLLLTGNHFRHQTLLGAVGTTRVAEASLGVTLAWGKSRCPQQFSPGLNSHLMLRLRSIRGVPTPQGPSGPPVRPNSTCSRGEHVLSTTSVLVTSRPRISTALGGLPSTSGASSRPSSSWSSPHGVREQCDGAARGPGLLGRSRELRLGEGLWAPCWAPVLLALSARRRLWPRGLASSPRCC